MRRLIARWLAGTLLALALLTLGACARVRPPPELFLLESLAPTLSSGSADQMRSPVVGVGPIRFPRYLERAQIVIAKTGGWVVPLDDQRWAESLGDNFSRVLAEDLAARVPTDRILMHPWPRTEVPDFKVTLRVNEFHLTETRLAKLNVRWELFGKSGLLASRKTVQQISARDPGVAAGVTAMSKTVDALSQEIAASIRAFWATNGAPASATR